MNFYVLKSIEFGPVVLNRIYQSIGEARFDEKPDPERFSLREGIAHLADWEPIFRKRMESILAAPGYRIVGEDESQRAIDNRYHEQDVFESLTRFETERATTTQFIRSLNPSDWSKFGVRDQASPMTIEDYANLLVCHDMYHIEFATQFL
jgi:hypothetical protein